MVLSAIERTPILFAESDGQSDIQQDCRNLELTRAIGRNVQSPLWLTETIDCRNLVTPTIKNLYVMEPPLGSNLGV